MYREEKLCMFCDFYFNSKYSFEEQKKIILNKFIYQPIIRLHDSVNDILLRNSQIEELIIIFDAFNFEVTLIEDYQKFKTREYGIEFDLHIHFDI